MSEETRAFAEEDVAQVMEYITQGGALKDLRGLSGKDMEAIYTIGYNLYSNGKFEDAQSIFKFLCFYDHLDKRFWMGLGACGQMLKQFDQAVNAYGYAAVMDPEDPRTPLHAAECFLAMGKFAEAESALNGAVHFSEGKADCANVKQRGEAMLQLLREKKKGGE